MTTFMRCQAKIVFSISVLPEETRQQCPVVRLGTIPYQREHAILGNSGAGKTSAMGGKRTLPGPCRGRGQVKEEPATSDAAIAN